MGLRAFFIVAAVLAGSSQIVEAAEQSVLRRVSCSVVRFYVAKYSAGAAEAYARSKGASEADLVQIIVETDPEKKPEKATQSMRSHLERARWMTEEGYRGLFDE